MLRTFYIIICCSKKFTYYTFDIIAYVACFSKCSRICNREWHIQKFCQCLNQICLTTTCWSNHKHVGFFDFDTIIFRLCHNTFIVIVNCYGHYFLCVFLSNYIFIKACLNLVWRWNGMNIQNRFYFLFLFLFLLESLTLWNTAKHAIHISTTWKTTKHAV